jgi:hypothetical protein
MHSERHVRIPRQNCEVGPLVHPYVRENVPHRYGVSELASPPNFKALAWCCNGR